MADMTLGKPLVLADRAVHMFTQRDVKRVSPSRFRWIPKHYAFHYPFHDAFYNPDFLIVRSGLPNNARHWCDLTVNFLPWNGPKRAIDGPGVHRNAVTKVWIILSLCI